MEFFTRNLILVSLFSVAIFAHAEQNNFSIHKVTKSVYRGGQPETNANFAELKAHGIKTVINLQGDGFLSTFNITGETPEEIAAEGEIVRKLGMNYINISFSAAKPLSRRGKKRLQRILTLMNRPDLQPVFVHCNVGVDRTGLMVALYRVQHQSCSYKMAKSLMYDEGQRLTPFFTTFLKPYLKEYSKEHDLKLGGKIDRSKCGTFRD